MLIRNFTGHEITFRWHGKDYKFSAVNDTPIDENILPYEVLESVYGNHRLVKIEKINNKHVGSNFDDFLKEEGIKDEVEKSAKEKVTLLINSREIIPTPVDCKIEAEVNPEEQQSLNPEILDIIIESEKTEEIEEPKPIPDMNVVIIPETSISVLTLNLVVCPENKEEPVKKRTKKNNKEEQ